VILTFFFTFIYPTLQSRWLQHFCPRLPFYRATTKDAACFTLTKALKTGAHAMPHSAPQPPTGGDPALEAEAAKLREAVARGVLSAQEARAREGKNDTGQSGAVTAARADADPRRPDGCRS
jgi:hypothetical protein